MKFNIEYEQEEDGRWLAEVLELPGALAYAKAAEEAISKVQALALRVLADRLEHGEVSSYMLDITCATWGRPQLINFMCAALSTLVA